MQHARQQVKCFAHKTPIWLLSSLQNTLNLKADTVKQEAQLMLRK